MIMVWHNIKGNDLKQKERIKKKRPKQSTEVKEINEKNDDEEKGKKKNSNWISIQIRSQFALVLCFCLLTLLISFFAIEFKNECA